MKQYSYLLIDADQTLLDFKKSEKCAIKELLDKFNIPYGEQDFKRYKEINRYCWAKYETGEYTDKETQIKRFQFFLEEKRCNNVDYCKINEEYQKLLSNYSFTINGAKTVLDYLSKKYLLSIITNGTGFVAKKRLKESGLSKYFEEIFISEEIGASKPSPLFFEKVFDKIKVDKSKALIIGDSLTSDILGGIYSNVDTCHVNFDKIEYVDINPTYSVNNLEGLMKLL